jgi:hypothetical protein
MKNLLRKNGSNTSLKQMPKKDGLDNTWLKQMRKKDGLDNTSLK